MEEINIIDEFDQAKTQDSVFYNYLQNNTNVAQYLNNEQKLLLLVNNNLHQKYNSDEFNVSLDNIWKLLGYTQKVKAKNVLEQNFILNKDYKFVINVPVDDEPIKKKHSRGGHNKENIFMTFKTYKLFCLKGNTHMTTKMQEYYIALEQMAIKNGIIKQKYQNI